MSINNKNIISLPGLFLGIVLCVFFVACGGGGGGGDAGPVMSPGGGGGDAGPGMSPGGGGGGAEPSTPSFGSETIDAQNYINGVVISTEMLPEATGGDGTLTYSIAPISPFGLMFDPTTRRLSGTPTTPGGSTASTAVTYTVEDADGETAMLMFSITVAADDQPSFGFSLIDDQEYTVGTAIRTITLPDATGGNGDLTYSLNPDSPAGLDFDENTQVFSGTPATNGITEVTYTVMDEDGDSVSLMFTINVAIGSRPSFDSRTIPDQEYVEEAASPIRDWFLPFATGGDGALTYSLFPTDDPGGELPEGLSFNSSNRGLSGTPADTGTATNEDVHTDMTYTVTDADGDIATLEFRITITDVERRPSFRHLPDIDSSDTELETFNQVFTQGVEIDPITFPAAQSGNPPLIYSLFPAIQGLSLDSTTRVLSGTPRFPTREFGSDAIVPRQITYRALDSNNNFADVRFTITVNEP